MYRLFSTEYRHEVARASQPGQADLDTSADPALTDTNVLLKVGMVGFCCSDLNSFRRCALRDWVRLAEQWRGCNSLACIDHRHRTCTVRHFV